MVDVRRSAACPSDRVATAQSRHETVVGRTRAGRAARRRAIILTVSVIIVSVAVLIASVRADEASPRVTAVATARAQIMSGVRIGSDQPVRDDHAPSRTMRQPRPRERPCPETDDHHCRLIVVDMP